MPTIRDTRKVRVSLVLRLDDFTTGYAIADDRTLKVVSEDGFFLPTVKPDGYFVFTNHRPEAVRITSDKYRGAVLGTEGHAGIVLRLSLIPRDCRAETIAVDGEAHVGFGGNGAGYALSAAVTAGGADIRPQNEDLRDITDLYHALIVPQETPEAVYVTKNLGGGRYALHDPPKRDYPARGTRLLPLYRVAGGAVPIPQSVETAYVLQNGNLDVRRL
ncbi:MAG: hypothetical protein LBE16_09095 [Clostridiales Family XIII bacterium]|jgi:hypothetical protein|nr:hypothetical protein [Clostridiales Family XIII bacterium]